MLATGAESGTGSCVVKWRGSTNKASLFPSLSPKSATGAESGTGSCVVKWRGSANEASLLPPLSFKLATDAKSGTGSCVVKWKCSADAAAPLPSPSPKSAKGCVVLCGEVEGQPRRSCPHPSSLSHVGHRLRERDGELGGEVEGQR